MTQPTTAQSSAPSAAAPAPARGPVLASGALYVGDLSPEVTEATLFELFNAVGPLASVRVCRDAATRRSLCYAYINFHSIEDAERALETMNFSEIRGKPCRIMWSQRDPALRRTNNGNIFVKNLAKAIDNKALYDTFSMFGNILSCKVATNAKGESLGYGFVHYETDEAAQNAIARVNNMMIAGEQVSVTAFKSKKERGAGDKNNFTNIYVKNLPESFTLDKLNELFAPFGTITSSVCPAGDGEAKCRGFGFVNMEKPEQAQAAVQELNNKEVEGKKLFVGRAQKKDERMKELRERFEQMKMERAKKYSGVNLYVKNMADDMDDERLRAEFAKFGTITSCKVMRDENQVSRGFGFVCFAFAEEATKAVSEMNGKMIERKPLYVALAQRKELRRAQLEAEQDARTKVYGQMYPAAPGPMYFQQPGPMNRAMYPAQMMGGPQQMQQQGRWGPQGQQQMQGRPMMGAPMGYMMPGAAGPMGPMRGGARGGRGGGPMRMNGQQQGRNVPLQQQSNFKYTDNARNRAAGAQQNGHPNGSENMAPPTKGQQQQQQPKALTIQALAAAPVEMQKQMIGERLFPMIARQEPQLAGKITGMLLEMDNGELLHLLESQDALQDKIQEALSVLNQAGVAPGAEATPQEVAAAN